MPIIAGSLSCRRFRVAEKPPPNFRDTYTLEIQRNVYTPPKTDRGEMRSIGWVNPRRILETRIDLDQVIFGSWLVLALRIDTISLNTRIYKARLAIETARVRKETGRERLGRDEKAAIEEKVQLEMAKKQTPGTSFQEMAWNLKTSEVLYTATGDKACLEFQGIFTETFDRAIEPGFPFLRAEGPAKKMNLMAELVAVMPAAFSPVLPRQQQPEIESE